MPAVLLLIVVLVTVSGALMSAGFPSGVIVVYVAGVLGIVVGAIAREVIRERRIQRGDK